MSNLIHENNLEFDDLIKIIENAKNRAYRKVNEELILMYMEVGKFVSEKLSESKYGDKVIDDLVLFFENHYPDLKGFNRRGLYRMRQFYELYNDDEIVSPLVTQLTWTNHLKIMSACKTREERHFYINLAIKERLSKRELARQIDSAYFERYMLAKTNLFPQIKKVKEQSKNLIIDTYVLDFLDLPDTFLEKDLQNAIIRNLKDFILEIGRDFTFVGEEYRIQIGNHDYYIDLLFYHRELECLVAFELKIGEFKAEYISKMDLYLEALDREVKKERENPSVGIILCASKDDEVVEFALSRTLSPTMVSEYNLKLIDKKLLQAKLKEYIEMADSDNID